jgi:outer membrane immunogenic protein
MQKFLLGILGLVSMAAPSVAADLPARTYNAPPLVIYDWTGLYIGGNGGWGSARNCLVFVPASGATIADGCLSKSGGLIGGQIGYRWQMGSVVLGLEAQGDWANLNSSHVSILNPVFTTGTKVNGLGLFTGQFGYAGIATLLYMKVGAAVTSNRTFISTTLGGVGLVSTSSTHLGAALGVGFDYAFSPNWTAGIEYDHLFMCDSNNSFSAVNPIITGALLRVTQDVDMVTLRVNYKFGGPVVARY